MMKEDSTSIPFGPAPARWAIALLLALFTAGVLAILPNLHAYYFGDEHFYTDSAIDMAQSGHLLTPTYPDGTPRFNKPVLSYWMILGGFRLFGISVLSSRLASLAAGLGILLLARLLAIRLFKSQNAGWLAMLILASNIELMSASMRATPDVFLCLFSLLSLYGFAGLLLGEARPSDVWIGFLGAGLAVASKGLLGILLLLFVLLLGLALPGRAARARALFRTPALRISLPLALVACAAIALAWFVAVYLKYGDRALNGFFHDQVGDRVSSSASTVLTNLFQYSLGLGLQYFPWSLLLLGALVIARDRLAQAWREHRPAFVFLLAWYALLLIVFSPANLTRTRYLLPAFPGLAVAAGGLLAAALERPALTRLLHGLFRLLLAALPVLGAGLLALAFLLEKTRLDIAAGAVFLLAAILGAMLLTWRQPNRSPLLKPAMLAFATFAILWSFQFLVRPAFPSTPCYSIVHKARKTGVTRLYFPRHTTEKGEDDNVRYKEKYASQVRLVSGGTIRVDRMSLDRYLSQPRFRPVLCFGEDAAHFPRSRFRIVQAGGIQHHDLSTRDFLDVIMAVDRAAALRRIYVPCYLVYPRRHPLPERTPAP